MVGQQEPVVTGDAVVLDVQIAQLPVRALSAMIDVIVVFIAYLIGVLLWASTLSQFDNALSAAVLIIFTVLSMVGYPIAFETATRGRSLGKMALGLRVVSEDGGPERFRQALFRALAGVIEIWIFAGGPAVICSLLSPKGKRIGRCRPSWRGGRRRCSCRASVPTRPSWHASSFPAHRNWIPASAIRWPTGSPARSSRRSRRRPRPVYRPNSCCARCWPSAIVVNSPGYGRRHRSLPHLSGRNGQRRRPTSHTRSNLFRHPHPIPVVSRRQASRLLVVCQNPCRATAVYRRFVLPNR
jgi:uncharacterized RDD family membrane protein YckC